MDILPNGDTIFGHMYFVCFADFIEDVNTALQTVYRKICRFVRSSYFTLWRIMEVHWPKILWCLIMVHCIKEVMKKIIN